MKRKHRANGVALGSGLGVANGVALGAADVFKLRDDDQTADETPPTWQTRTSRVDEAPVTAPRPCRTHR